MDKSPAASAREGNYTGYEGVFLIAEDGPDTLPEGRYLSYSYRGSTVHNAEASRNCSPTPGSMDLRPGHGFLSCSGLISISLRTRTNTSQNFSFLSPERTSPFSEMSFFDAFIFHLILSACFFAFRSVLQIFDPLYCRLCIFVSTECSQTEVSFSAWSKS